MALIRSQSDILTPLALPQADAAIHMVKVRILPDGRMTSEDAARYLGLKPKTLAMWRFQRKGPPWIKFGGRIFYFKGDLDSSLRGGADKTHGSSIERVGHAAAQVAIASLRRRAPGNKSSM